MRASFAFTRNDGGFTTPAAAVALLVVCALLAVSVRGVAIGTRSGQVQYVADAAALAADNVVADFVTIGQVVDAVLVSFSLAAVSVYAVSVVAAFIPGGQGVAEKCVEIGQKIFNVRDRFAKSAIKGLNSAQKALPALAAVRAYQCVSANARASGIDYAGTAVTLPLDGVEVSLPDNKAVEESMDDVAGREGEIQENAVEQQRAQEKIDDAKRRAWEADCGGSPMSMYERAGHLASMHGADNPCYATVDAWGFDVPLARAKAYYRVRYAYEPGAGLNASPELVAESVARKRFYAYALDEVSKGSVGHTSQGSELPDLRSLARNTSQIRETFLYTEAIYPTTMEGGERVLHAYVGCPGATGASSGTASVAEIDAGGVRRCEVCKYAASTLGRVPSPSTSIDNGFEYYYRLVVEASREYRDAVLSEQEASQALEEAREDTCEDLRDALTELNKQRYDPQPPGRYGCVCVVFAPATAISGLPFAQGAKELPARMAISGATLAPDHADDAGTVISDIGEGLIPRDMIGSGLIRKVFEAWSALLKAYVDGHQGVLDMFDSTLGAIPLVGSDLSERAATSFKKTLKDVGLEPPDLDTYKPILVNTSHVLATDDSGVGARILQLKQAAELYGVASAQGIEGLVRVLRERAPDFSTLVEEGIEVGRVPWGEWLPGASDGSLVLPAPQNLPELYDEALASASQMG